MKDRCGTPVYIAPEILREGTYDGIMADVWSAGVVLYTMIYGDFPFRSNNIQGLEQQIVNINYNMPEDTSGEVRDLISKMLTTASSRISIAEVYEHPWLQDIDYSCSFCINE